MRGIGFMYYTCGIDGFVIPVARDMLDRTMWQQKQTRRKHMVRVEAMSVVMESGYFN